jgi:prepilin-type N-terminal cleavage/methylation domain-containing protein
MKKNQAKKPAFTLIEVLVVIAIIALLAVSVVVVFSGTRARSRDAARLSDVNRIRAALDLYWQSAGVYPSEVNPEETIEHNGNIFMSSVPRPQEPTDDGDCPLLTGEDLKYTYEQIGTGGSMSYRIDFCLGNGGDHIATPHGITEAPEE